MMKLLHIYKNYGNGNVLEDVNLQFVSGKCYVLKGVSGCGKTTLLNILGGLDSKYEGTYLWNEQSVATMNKKETQAWKSQIGYVFQESLLVQHLNVVSNLELIYHDHEMIEAYAKQFNVTSLLKKYPEQLSGGERQRIALIRALLTQAPCMIADEPTAPLDERNSLEIVDAFRKLKAMDKIVIISTHEDIFDEIADEIIQLDYGKCESNISSIEIVTEAKPTLDLQKKPTWKSDVNYSRQKRSYFHKRNYIATMLLSILVGVILLGIAVGLRFKEAYMEQVKSQYPVAIFDILNNAEKLPENYTEYVVVYEDYQIHDETGTIFTLLPQEKSSFNIEGAIKEGSFPQKDNEVLITPEYRDKYFHGERDVIGKTIHVEQVEEPLIVSGVLSDDPAMNQVMYFSNYYYGQKAQGPCIFAMETIMKQYGTKVLDNRSLMVEVKGDQKNNVMYERYYEDSFWNRYIQDYVTTAQIITSFLMFLLIIGLVVTVLFLYNIIYTRLFYRKKELGYLQLFHLQKKQIKIIVYSDYILYVLPSIIIGTTLYVVGVLWIQYQWGLNLSLHPFVIAMLIFSILLYVICIVVFPLRKILKKDILELIK